MNCNLKFFIVVLFSVMLLFVSRLFCYRPSIDKNTIFKHLTLNESSRNNEGLSLHEEYHLMKMAPFEISNKECDVLILANSTDYKKVMDAQDEPRICTFSYFDDYFQTTGQFYGKGYWDDSRPGYIPKDCTFSRLLDKSGQIEACLVRKNITRILVTGDSTGRILLIQLVEYLKNQTDVSCTLKKHTKGFNMTVTGHNMEKELEYFVVPPLPTHSLVSEPCGFAFTGYSFQYEFIYHKTNRVLLLEYISSVRAIDTTLHINRSAVRSSQPMRAENKMEYLLRYYFPYHGFPDLWIYSPYFRHECWSTSAVQLMADLSYLFNMLEIYAPTSTDLLFLGDTRVCENMMSPDAVSAFRNKHKLSQNEQIHRFNQILYHVLRPFHSRMENWHAFFEGMKVTCPIVCRFHEDGSHLQDRWFLDLGRNILDVFCLK